MVTFNPILPVQGVPDIAPAAAKPAAGSAQPGGFGAAFEGAVQKVEGARSAAEISIENLLSGQGGELHSAALATQKAELAFEMFLQVRNKVVQAYQEVMRMPM